MSDDKQQNYKITDRRKFNPDGTPREGFQEPAGPPEATPAAEAVKGAEHAPPESRTDNVVSFPPQSSAPSGASAQAPSRAPEPTPAAPPPQQQTPQQKAAEQAYKQTSRTQPSQMPPASFLAIVNMLGIEAAMSLGMVQVPGQEEPQIDLEAARHIIDLLGVLQTKTRGNLTPEEDNLLENLLADLRMQFVSLSGRQ